MDDTPQSPKSPLSAIKAASEKAAAAAAAISACTAKEHSAAAKYHREKSAAHSIAARQAKSSGRQEDFTRLQAKIASHDSSAEQHLLAAATLEKHDAAKLVAEHKAAAAYHKERAAHHRSAAAISAAVVDGASSQLFVSKHTRAAEHHDECAAFHEAAEHTAPDAAPELNTEFLISLQMLCRYVSATETPLLGRVMRSIMRLRKLCSPVGLFQLYSACMPSPAPGASRDVAAEIATLPQSPDVKITAVSKDLSAMARKRPNEAAVLVQWVATAFLVQENQNSLAFHVSESLLALLHDINLRSLDAVQARAFFFLSLSAERLGSLPSIRERLMLTYRTCVLLHNTSGQATLLNLLLRNYLKANMYEQADALLSKATFPETEVSNNQHARYLYYSGRVKAVQLNYTASYGLLLAAQRKAPQYRARGFRIAVLKLATVVQLLMGDIPDKSSLTSPDTAVAVSAYKDLASAVRSGELETFQRVSQQHAAVFARDGLRTLVARLRVSVIKAGLRKIASAYGAIPLETVRARLNLSSVEDTEYVVAKALHDGVIDGKLDGDTGILTAQTTTNVYSTNEPQAQFHKRIGFCLELHNSAVRSMRFPPETTNKQEAVVDEFDLSAEDLEDMGMF